MPLEKLPLHIRTRIEEAIQEEPIIIDLSNDSLSDLNKEQFEDLGAFLAGRQDLEALVLRNCDLAKVSIDNLRLFFKFLPRLKQLHTIDISDNGLSYNTRQVNLVFAYLSQLPRLNQLVFMDSDWEDTVPAFFEQLRTMPFLRVYKGQNTLSSSSDLAPTNSICFLSGLAVDALIDAICANKVIARRYLGPIDERDQSHPEHPESQALQLASSSRDNLSFTDLFNRHPTINEHYQSSEFSLVYPISLMNMVRFFERLKVPGLSWRNEPIKKGEQFQNKLIVNINQGYATSFESLLESLTANPNRLKQTSPAWTLELPDFRVSHRAIDLYEEAFKLKADLPVQPEQWQQLITWPSTEAEQKSLTEARNHLTKLAGSFSNPLSFHTLTQDGGALKLLIGRLKGLVKHKQAAIRHLTYEFFINHQLVSTHDITNLDSLHEVLSDYRSRNQEVRKAAGNKLSALNKEITFLLQLNQVRLEDFLKVEAPVKGESPGKDPVATAQLVLQALAWWGMVAYHHKTPEAIAGMYWYGCYLTEFPIANKHFLYEPSYEVALSEARKTGAYWLRYLVHHFGDDKVKHDKAQDCLMKGLKQISSTARRIAPAEQYQYMQVRNLYVQDRPQPELSGSCSGSSSEDVLPHAHHWHQLFPNVSFAKLIAMVRRLEVEKGGFQVFLQVADISRQTSSSSFDEESFFNECVAVWKLLTGTLSVPASSSLYVQQFFLYSLISDDLISDPQKSDTLKKLLSSRASAYAALSTSSLLQEEQKVLKRYKEVPLGRHLNYYFLAQDSVLRKAMHQHPENKRIRAFCERVVETIDDYLDKGELSSIEVKQHDKPKVVAADLMINLLKRALNDFKLNNTDFGESIQERIRLLENVIREDSVTRVLVQPSYSLAFKQELTRRLECYQSLATLVNGARIKLLPEFGAALKEVEENHWTHKLLHVAELGMGALHVVLPVVLVVSGAGIPLALGSVGAAILTKVHHAAEWLEETIEHHKLDEGLHGLKHLVESAHPHKKTKSYQDDRLNHLRFFNTLLARAGCSAPDKLHIIIEHFTAVYQPVTAKLSQHSNAALAALLVTLFLRGLGIRYELQEDSKKLPTTLAGLCDYFAETLWMYSYYTQEDDVLLVAEDGQTFSALQVIFPQLVQVKASNDLWQVAISTPTRRGFYNGRPIPRNASSYEVEHINRLKEPERQYQGPFKLSTLDKLAGLRFAIAYQEPKSIKKNFSLLYSKANLGVIIHDIDQLKDYYDQVVEQGMVSQEEIQAFRAYLIPLSNDVKTIVRAAIKHQLRTPGFDTTYFIQTELRKNRYQLEQNVQKTIETYTNRASAFLILLTRKYPGLRLLLIDQPLASKAEAVLFRLIGADKKYFVVQQASIAEGVSATQDQGADGQALLTTARVLSRVGILAPNRAVTEFNTKEKEHALNAQLT